MTIRLKTGSTPGDVSKHQKEAMLESTGKYRNKRIAKTYRTMVKMKEKAVLKERAKKEIARQLVSLD